MVEQIEDILEYWFGMGKTATAVANEKKTLWWSKNDDIDMEIINRFAATTEAAVNDELDDWEDSSRGLLALIICTDQFSRNMYRDTPRAFSGDPVALGYARQCVVSRADQQLKPIERVFAYLPFEHSEERAEQQRSLDLFQALAASVGADETALFEGYYQYAIRHYEIVDRFGRFPHRNQMLQRQSTDDELNFLEQPGSSF